jgi:hypothetical protein
MVIEHLWNNYTSLLSPTNFPACKYSNVPTPAANIVTDLTPNPSPERRGESFAFERGGRVIMKILEYGVKAIR